MVTMESTNITMVVVMRRTMACKVSQNVYYFVGQDTFYLRDSFFESLSDHIILAFHTILCNTVHGAKKSTTTGANGATTAAGGQRRRRKELDLSQVDPNLDTHKLDYRLVFIYFLIIFMSVCGETLILCFPQLAQ